MFRHFEEAASFSAWALKRNSRVRHDFLLTSHSIGQRLSLNSEPNFLMSELSNEFRLQTAPLRGTAVLRLGSNPGGCRM